MKIHRKELTEKEFKAALKKIPLNNIKLALVLGYYQCMRVSEVADLDMEDIDLSNGYIIIRSKMSREIPILTVTRPLLKYMPVGVGVRSIQYWLARVLPSHTFEGLRIAGLKHHIEQGKLSIGDFFKLSGTKKIWVGEK